MRQISRIVLIVIVLAQSTTALAESNAQDFPPRDKNKQPAPPDTTDSVPGRALGVGKLDGEREAWRYVQHHGAWWYWLPSNQWVVWNEIRWVAPSDMPPPGWDPLFYVPQFDRPFAGAVFPAQLLGAGHAHCQPVVPTANN